MDKKTIIIIIGVFGLFAILYLLNQYIGDRLEGFNGNQNELSDYLDSPWVTERTGWFFVSLPEKWKLDNSEFVGSKDVYDELANEANMYEMTLKDFHLLAMHIDAKAGYYDHWNLDVSAEATINQMLNNLDCSDINLAKLPPQNNLLLVNFTAVSNCGNKEYKAFARGMRYENQIFFICNIFKDSDTISSHISKRILNSIENKYPRLPGKN